MRTPVAVAAADRRRSGPRSWADFRSSIKVIERLQHGPVWVPIYNFLAARTIRSLGPRERRLASSPASVHVRPDYFSLPRNRTGRHEAFLNLGKTTRRKWRRTRARAREPAHD